MYKMIDPQCSCSPLTDAQPVSEQWAHIQFCSKVREFKHLNMNDYMCNRYLYSCYT